MKKLFFLLFAVVMLTACNKNDHDIINEILRPSPAPEENPTIIKWEGDWNDPNSSNYKPEGYNPIEGQWIVMNENKVNVNYFRVYQFGNTRRQSISTSKPAEGKDPIFEGSKAYMINNIAFKIEDAIFGYELSDDSKILKIKIGNTTYTLIPYSEWKWNGDWNNPSDPHYITYEGRYNPVVGIWKLVNIAGTNVANPTTFYRFNQDFTVETSTSNIITFITKRKYWINDTSLKEDAFSVAGTNYASTICKYTIKGDSLYYKTISPISDQLIFVRFK